MVLDAESRFPVPGFAEAVVGMAADESRTFSLTYPEDHYNADVAGQEAEFKVHVGEIRSEVLPDLDDEFAVMVGDYEDLEDLKAKLRQNLEEQAENAADQAFEEAMWDALLETASVEYPDAALTQEINEYQRQFEAQMRNQGVDLETFFQLTNTTQETWREEIRPQAIERLKRRHILTEIIEAEAVEATDEEIDAEIERVLEPMGERADDMRELLTSEPGKLSVKQDLLVTKAQDLLKTLLVAGDASEATPALDVEVAGDETEVEASAEEAAEVGAEPVETQDLAKIEGIGPKTKGLLYDAGIVTFAQLADTDLGRLKEILDAAGSRYRAIKPDTWPQQARLAAEAKWDELRSLQDNISGGVIVGKDEQDA
jgi:trigger factor